MNGRILLLTILTAWSTICRTQSIPTDALGSVVFSERRSSVAQTLKTGQCAIVFSGALRSSGHHSPVPLPFSPEPDFFYLTGLEQPNSVLVIFPEAREFREGASSELLFLPDPKQLPLSVMGYGYPGQFGLETNGLLVRSVAQFRKFCLEVLDHEAVGKILGLPVEPGDFRVYSQDLSFRPPLENLFSVLAPHFQSKPEVLRHYRSIARVDSAGVPALQREVQSWLNYFDREADPILERFIAARNPEMVQAVKSEIGKIKFDFVELEKVMHKLRGLKSDSEIDALRASGMVAAKAVRAGLGNIVPGCEALTIEAHMALEIGLASARPARSLQVLGGKPGETLLAAQNQGQLGKDDLVVLDVATRLNGYVAHLGRTAPVSGALSSGQANVYAAAEAAHRKMIAACKVGEHPNELAYSQKEALVKSLDPIVLNNGQRRSSRENLALISVFPIGLDLYEMDNPAALQAGMVFEVSTFVTIPKHKRYKPDLQGELIVLRDMVLIAETGPVWLSKSLPLKMDEIRALVGNASEK